MQNYGSRRSNYSCKLKPYNVHKAIYKSRALNTFVQIISTVYTYGIQKCWSCRKNETIEWQGHKISFTMFYKKNKSGFLLLVSNLYSTRNRVWHYSFGYIQSIFFFFLCLENLVSRRSKYFCNLMPAKIQEVI